MSDSVAENIEGIRDVWKCNSNCCTIWSQMLPRNHDHPRRIGVVSIDETIVF
jgi:hypothetical protein